MKKRSTVFWGSFVIFSALCVFAFIRTLSLAGSKKVYPDYKNYEGGEDYDFTIRDSASVKKFSYGKETIGRKL